MLVWIIKHEKKGKAEQSFGIVIFRKKELIPPWHNNTE